MVLEESHNDATFHRMVLYILNVSSVSMGILVVQMHSYGIFCRSDYDTVSGILWISFNVQQQNNTIVKFKFHNQTGATSDEIT